MSCVWSTLYPLDWLVHSLRTESTTSLFCLLWLNSTSKSNLRGKEFISTYTCSSLWREIRAGTFRQELKQKSLKNDINLFPRFIFSYTFYTYQNYLARSSTSYTQPDLSNQWINQEFSPKLAQRPICWRRFLNWGFLDNSSCVELTNQPRQKLNTATFFSHSLRVQGGSHAKLHLLPSLRKPVRSGLIAPRLM